MDKTLRNEIIDIIRQEIAPCRDCATHRKSERDRAARARYTEILTLPTEQCREALLALTHNERVTALEIVTREHALDLVRDLDDADRILIMAALPPGVHRAVSTWLRPLVPYVRLSMQTSADGSRRVGRTSRVRIPREHVDAMRAFSREFGVQPYPENGHYTWPGVDLVHAPWTVTEQAFVTVSAIDTALAAYVASGTIQVTALDESTCRGLMAQAEDTEAPIARGNGYSVNSLGQPMVGGV